MRRCRVSRTMARAISTSPPAPRSAPRSMTPGAVPMAVAQGRALQRLRRSASSPTAASSRRIVAPASSQRRYRAPKRKPNAQTPFVLNTGRMRDQWHTMTRTGVAPRLSQHIAEPFAEINPARRGCVTASMPAGLVRISNELGSVVMLRAQITERQRHGSLFAPIHWTDQNSPQRARRRADRGECRSHFRPAGIQSGRRSPRSPGLPPGSASRCCARGQRAFRRIFGDRAHGFRLAGRDGGLARTQGLGRFRAGTARRGRSGSSSPIAAPRRVAGSRARTRARRRLVIVAREPVAASRAVPCEAIRARDCDANALLAGKPAGAQDPGRMICVCHGVGASAIVDAIEAHALEDAQAVGRQTKAGTGCGSCRPEIHRLLKDAASRVARSAEIELTGSACA